MINDLDFPCPDNGAILYFLNGTHDGEKRPLPSLGRYFLGRDPSCDIIFDAKNQVDARASERHACITVQKDGVYINNNHSTNGLRIMDEHIVDDEWYPLADDCLIQLGGGGPRILLRHGCLAELDDADMYGGMTLDTELPEPGERSAEEERHMGILLRDLWISGQPRDKIRRFIVRYYAPLIENAIARSLPAEKRLDCIADAITDFSTPGLNGEASFWLDSYDPDKGLAMHYLSTCLKRYVAGWRQRGGMAKRATGTWGRTHVGIKFDAAADRTSPTLAMIEGNRADKYRFTAAATETRRRECLAKGNTIECVVFHAVFPGILRGQERNRKEVAARLGMPMNTVNAHIANFINRVHALLWWGAWLRVNHGCAIQMSMAVREAGSGEEKEREREKDRNADKVFIRWGARLPACREDGEPPAPPAIDGETFAKLLFQNDTPPPALPGHLPSEPVAEFHSRRFFVCCALYSACFAHE